MDTIIGSSSWTRQIRTEISRIAKHGVSVMITGATGTGKGVIARAVHAASDRAHLPFVPVDCTTIVGTLFSSQLFGHRKGSFTGSAYEAMGCFRAADGGTIFLDELGEMDLEIQAKLLKVIEERKVQPLGSDEQIPVDVRIISATNRDLFNEVHASRFREDLFYRLRVVHLTADPLKNRSEDIEPLTRHFLAEMARRHGVPEVTVSPGAREYLTCLEWPGNIRQLRHLIEQAVIYCDGACIDLELLQRLVGKTENNPFRRSPINDRDGLASTQTGRTPDPIRQTAAQKDPWTPLSQLEREHIVATLEHTYYNQTAAAKLLQISRSALIRKVKKYQIDLPHTAIRVRARSGS